MGKKFFIFVVVCLLAYVLFYLQGLTLVSAPHLARSFHHLFPLQAFVESPVENLQGDR